MEQDEDISTSSADSQKRRSEDDSATAETNSTGTDPKKRRVTEAVNVPSSSATTNNSLPAWVAGGSPAHFVSPDELLKMSIAMDNLALVHEIAIDPNFSVSEVPANPIEAAVKENMYRAYWDILSEELRRDPPNYTHAFNLLMEIKQTILTDILSSAHVRLRAEVESVLDESESGSLCSAGNGQNLTQPYQIVVLQPTYMFLKSASEGECDDIQLVWKGWDTLRNKMEQNCLDVHEIGKFIVDLLGRLCAPERDTLVEKLRHEEEVVELIKGIFSLMDIMKNDLTNYTISQNRDAVEAYSAQFEYKEFLKYLDKFPDGSMMTKEWLKLAYADAFPSTSIAKPKAEAEEEVSASDEEVVITTSKGYLRLVESESPSPYPETLRIDRMRMCALAEKFLQMNIVTSAVFVTCNFAGKQISESEGFKKSLKDQLIVITNDIEEKNLTTTVESVCEQCIVVVKKTAADLSAEIPEEQIKMLRNQLHAIADEHNAIRILVCKRIEAFINEMLCSPSEVPRRLLPGLSVIQSELCAFTARLLRICIHNRKTFFELYRNMLKTIKRNLEDSAAPS